MRAAFRLLAVLLVLATLAWAQQRVSSVETQDHASGPIGQAVPPSAMWIGGNSTNGQLQGLMVCDQRVTLNFTATSRIIVGSANKQTILCNVLLVVGSATNVNFVEGTGTTCATATTGLMGGTSASLGLNLAANSGFVLPAGMNPWMKTSTVGDDVCVQVSSAAQVSGVVWFAQL